MVNKVKQTRKRRQRLYHENHVYHLDKDAGTTKYYRCIKRTEPACSGRCISVYGLITLTQGHTSCDGIPEREQAKDAAIEKLKQLTMASECVKAIELVRQVIKEMPPEARHLMPSEDSLRRRVGRWANQAAIKIVRPTPEDYVKNMVDQGDAENSRDDGNSKSGEPSALFASIKLEPQEEEIDEDDVEDLGNGLKILKNKKINGRYRIMIKNQIYNWKKDYTGRSMYRCREGRIGCPVTATVYNDDNRYILKWKHKHELPVVKQRKHKNRKHHGLKLVDDDGNQIGVVDSIDDIPVTGGVDGSSSIDIAEWFNNPSTSEDVQGQEHGVIGDDGPMDDGGDDFQADFDPGDPDPVESESISFNDNKTTNNIIGRSIRTPKNVAKSGERCYVCGDELLVSETLASSQETFRKACCYLNVKSKSEWFPRMDSSKFYSFCESCTTEITRIHQLYKKVDEIQSLIFKKVENVEKRIADAEIVDNWMAEAPHSSALRFEGFRKQVLINYRNKLKVRREVRVGKKMGHDFVEIQPMRSAHMFATDPAATNAFSKSASVDDVVAETPPAEPPRRGRGRPRKCVESAIVEQSSVVEESSHFDDADDCQEEWPEEPEKETKFWKDDPSKLNVGNVSVKEKEDEDGDDMEPPADNLIEASDDNASDGNDNDDGDDSDDDWTVEKRQKKSTTRKSTSAAGPINQKETVTKRRPMKQDRFPDTIVRKDGRLFMQGIEIVKLPPGSYSRMPYNEVFMCGACDKMMVSFWKIREHICGTHLELYKCPICAKPLAEPRLILKHIERKHKDRKFDDCKICGRPLKGGSPETMKYHIYTHLGEEEKKDPQYASYCPPYKKDPNRPKRIIARNTQTFQCSQCGKTFLIASALKRHELTHGGDAVKVQCQHCGKTYAHHKALGDHLNICSFNKNITRQSYPCPKCPQRFKNRSTRSKHLRKHDHSKPTPYSCSKCPRRFTSRNGYKNHIRLCTETPKSDPDNIYQAMVPEHSPTFAHGHHGSAPVMEVKPSTSSQPQPHHSITYFHDSMGILQYPTGFSMHHSGGQ